MKKIILLCFCISTSTLFSQEISIGVKSGLSFITPADQSSFFFNITSFEDGQIVNSDRFRGTSDFGYRIGTYGRIDFKRFFVQSELLFVNISGSFDDGPNGFTGDYSFSRLDIPLYLGLKFWGPLYVKGGLIFQFPISDRLRNTNPMVEEPFEFEDSANVGWQIGLGAQFKRFGVEFFVEDTIDTIDTSPSSTSANANGNTSSTSFEGPQLGISVSYDIFKLKKRENKE